MRHFGWFSNTVKVSKTWKMFIDNVLVKRWKDKVVEADIDTWKHRVNSNTFGPSWSSRYQLESSRWGWVFAIPSSLYGMANRFTGALLLFLLANVEMLMLSNCFLTTLQYRETLITMYKITMEELLWCMHVSFQKLMWSNQFWNLQRWSILIWM